LAVIAFAELIAIMMVSTIDQHGHIDGEVYQIGARAWLQGHDLYDNLPATEFDLQLPFIYPPFAAIVFAPLAVVPKTVAVVTITVATHVALLLALYVVLSASTFLRGHRDKVLLVTAAVLPLATISEPLEETIGYSQINVVLMAMVVVDCLWRTDGKRKPPYPRGLLIGIAAGLKLTPAAFLLFFLLRKDFRAMAVTIATFASTVVLGVVLAFDDSIRFWLQGKMLASATMSFGTKFVGDASTYAGNQSLRSLISKLELAHLEMNLILAVLALLVLALATAGMLDALRRKDLPMAVVINGVVQLLVSPISWSHHWVWAIPGLLLLMGAALQRRDWPLLVMATMASAFFMTGPHWKMPQGKGLELQWNVFEHVVGNSYVFWGLAFLLYAAYGWWRHRRQVHQQDTGDRRAEVEVTPATT
jgi:alpha-1,2-mannosyltransferase